MRTTRVDNGLAGTKGQRHTGAAGMKSAKRLKSMAATENSGEKVKGERDRNCNA